MIKRRQQSGGHNRHKALIPTSSDNTPEIFLPGVKSARHKIFMSDPGEPRHGSRFKWLISTCLAGAVGLGAIGMVMYASMNIEDGSGVVKSIKHAGLAALKPFQGARLADEDLRVSGRKTGRIQTTSRGLSTKHIIHDTVVQQRNNREFIKIKPYARLVASLSTEKPDNIKAIPAFNPFKLYSNPVPVAQNDHIVSSQNNKSISIKVMELVGGILPEEDGQELPLEEVHALVAEAGETYSDEPVHIKPGIHPEHNDKSSAAEDLPGPQTLEQKPTIIEDLPPNTTVIVKHNAPEDVEEIEQRELKVIKVRRGDSLMRLLTTKGGAEKWQANAIAEAMNPVYPANALQAKQEMRLTLVPAPTDTGAESNKMEPLAFSLYTGDKHEVTVARNNAGDYIASKEPIDLTVARTMRKNSYPQRATVYTSIYTAALAQKLSPAHISKLLRIHSYDVDYKRRVRAGDKFEAFFDLNEADQGEEATPGELLYTSITIDNQTRVFYRYRSPDGTVDYYDRKGSSAKKFLMRKPVRGGGVRFTSSFGPRWHPILKTRRMHRGVDWAAKRGTPILAAGNGVVEVAGRKGGFGHYIRLRHANGYKTAYGHLYRYAKGLRPGLKVRQGQVIGYVGSSGRSTGAHLHYEVLVNNRHVNPMKIEVPRGRLLKGRQLAEFQKERDRIDELMRRAPVKTRVAKAGK